jgi:DNA-binding Xre family transcriptional regulator
MAIRYESDAFNMEWLIVTLDDGDRIIFDSFENTIRRIPRDSGHLSEIEARKEFGVRLRKLMFQRGITQTELSNCTNISQARLSDYITGKHSPSFYIVDKIAKVLECSTDEFRCF